MGSIKIIKNLVICPQREKCKQMTCPHYIPHIAHKYTLIQKSNPHGFTYNWGGDCSHPANRGICPIDPEKRITFCKNIEQIGSFGWDEECKRISSHIDLYYLAS